MNKECTSCHEVKPPSEFHSSNKTSDGRKHQCKICTNNKAKEWREKNAHRVRESWRRASGKYYEANSDEINLKKCYGLSLDEYYGMLYKQNGCCAVCGNSGKLVVDHCHETGAVRALLCGLCNSAIGFFKEDVGVLQSAIYYLKQHKP